MCGGVKMLNTRVRWYGGRILDSELAAANAGIEDVMEFILGESQDIAPFDEGTLITNSGTRVSPTSRSGSVFYDTPYAVRLHEHPEYQFQNGREGKYLSKIMEREKGTIQNFLANAIRGGLS